MSVIVTDKGFTPVEQYASPVSQAIEITSDTDPEGIDLQAADLIAIDFPSFADGRGFTIASVLRRRGFKGVLRAKGHVIADQYTMARRSGFDEVEISDELAQRQPEHQWKFRANWQAHDYQSRLRRG